MLAPRMFAALSSVALLVMLAAQVGHAKSPPSAFGEAFEKYGASGDARRDVDDAAPDGVPRERVRKAPQRVNPRARQKIRLDGSQGTHRDDDGSDDDW